MIAIPKIGTTTMRNRVLNGRKEAIAVATKETTSRGRNLRKSELRKKDTLLLTARTAPEPSRTTIQELKKRARLAIKPTTRSIRGSGEPGDAPKNA